MTGEIDTAYDIATPDPEFDPDMIAQAASEAYPEEEVATTDAAAHDRTADGRGPLEGEDRTPPLGHEHRAAE